MSEHLKLGQLITEPQQRDAIHIAVVPMVAAESMQPGTRCGVTADNKAARTTDFSTYVGIVDPFLREAVPTGAKFWLYLEPGSITSLRHDWTHPMFPAESQPPIDKAASEQWLRDFADSSDCPGFHVLMAVAEDFCEGETGWSEEYLHFNGSDAHGDIPPEFWTHFEVVTGKKPQGTRPTFFSCSC